ncbi:MULTISPECIES: hypothetical protein [Promicromonospora]|uniref:DUF1918 domain-containing protein n=2 Tax=Promicromonospora TaxID=43676 RepID=A0ABW4V1M9_9MICO
MPEIVVMTPRWEKGEEIGWQCATVVKRITGDAYVVRFDDGHEAGAFQSRMLCGPAEGKAIVDMPVTA